MTPEWTPAQLAIGLAVLLLAALAPVQAADTTGAPIVIKRSVWDWDASDIAWYSGKPPATHGPGGPADMNGWAEYKVQIPKTAWYELYFTGGVPGWDHDVFVDGKHITRGPSANEDIVTQNPLVYKEVNLPLTAGLHVLRIRRLLFPGVLPDSWELREATGPAGTVWAQVVGHRVLRVGETLTLQVTGGCFPQAEHYDLVTINGITGERTYLGAVDFPAGDKFVTTTLKFPMKAEGVFHILGVVGQNTLRPADLRAGEICVIDTHHAPTPTVFKKTLIHDIDCVKQTDMGKPIVTGQGFWEATEPTRISTSAAGTYRESGDGTNPNLPYPPNAPAYRKYNSGFSYAIDVPEPQQCYLLEVDYPDDDRRTVNIFVAEPEKTQQDMPCQLYGGYETGDWYELSNKMQTEQIVFWARGTVVRACILSKCPGMRAAAARIRVYKLDNGLPAGPPSRPDGRIFDHWLEEPTRWLQHGVPPANLGPMERDFIGIERYVQLARFHGFNAVSPTEVIYQDCTYDSHELQGWFIQPYDAARMVALMCEKYGLQYIPEIHLSDQAWFDTHVVEKLVPAKDKDNLYIRSRLGTVGGASWFAAPWDPLYPAIQDEYLRIVGELADKVGDSPAFGGISSRLMSWVWQGWNGLASLNWGYGDWDMKAFEKDTGISVPGDKTDPDRFEKRFEFLTSDAMRDKWVAWRDAKMLDFYRRLRDRIRQDNPNAMLYLPYFGDAKSGMDLIFGSYFGTPKGALREVGIDLNALAKEPGIVLVPMGTFGRRDLGDVVADAGVSDSIADPALHALGFGYERAYGFANAYFEDQAQVPLSQLGIPWDPKMPGGNDGAADAAGRNILEKLSLALADQDSGFLRQGGMGYTFGQTPEYWEWLAEYEQLPRLPFTALPEATDPVAVWYRDCPDGFYFYAVNREPYALSITLHLPGATTVTELGNGQAVPTPGGKLVLALKSFQLRAFRTDKGTQITGATTVVPAARIQLVRDRLAFCQELAQAVTTGDRKNDLSDTERAAFLKQLDIAWQAAGEQHWWRARTAISDQACIRVFQDLATWPPDQLHRRMGLGLLTTENRGITEAAAAPMLTAAELQPHLAAGGDAQLVDATTYDPTWQYTQVLKTQQGAVDVDLPVAVPGRYRLSLGYVAPQPGALTVSLGGQPMAILAQVTAPNQPQKTVFPVVALPGGTVRLAIRGQGSFGVYGVTLQPVYRPLPSPNWATIGPFPTGWATQQPVSLVKTAMDRVDPPMQEINFNATYPGADGRTVRWEWDDQILGGPPHFNEQAGVSFLFRAKVQESHVCYAATFITSPTERDAEILVGCDWWANAYLNGEKLVSNRDPKQVAADGCAFNGWRPLPANVHLKKGVNVLLVKAHGGTVANWFTCYISDPGDLQVSAKP